MEATLRQFSLEPIAETCMKEARREKQLSSLTHASKILYAS